MPGKFLYLTLLMIGCATPVVQTGPWRYERPDFSGYTRIPSGDVVELAQRAKANFSASPVAAHFRAPLQLQEVWRRSDGRTVMVFYFGDSDARAIFVFDVRGEIIDRYVHSYWR
jgi:hypothetical protein